MLAPASPCIVFIPCQQTVVCKATEQKNPLVQAHGKHYEIYSG